MSDIAIKEKAIVNQMFFGNQGREPIIKNFKNYHKIAKEVKAPRFLAGREQTNWLFLLVTILLTSNRANINCGS